VAAISISTSRRASSFSGTGCRFGWMKRKMSVMVDRRLHGASTLSMGNVRCCPFTFTVTCLGSCSGHRSMMISGTSRWMKSSAPTSMRFGSRRFLSK